MPVPKCKPAGTTDDHRGAEDWIQPTGAGISSAPTEEAEVLEASVHTGSQLSREPMLALHRKLVRFHAAA